MLFKDFITQLESVKQNYYKKFLAENDMKENDIDEA